MEILSLAQTGFDSLFPAFEAAFADYEMQLDALQLQKMLTRRGFDPTLSFAAFDGDRIAAFTLNGIGTWKGLRTAYDTGTGTLPQYRNQGLATRIFEFSLPFLRQAGIRRYLLEVLQHNEKAISVYRKLGFRVSREFNYFRTPREQLPPVKRLGCFTGSVRCLDRHPFGALPDYGDFLPSWQNSDEAIARSSGDFIVLGAYEQGDWLGYCVLEPAAGDIARIAVRPDQRRRGIGSALLQEALNRNRAQELKIINTEVRCTALTEFLRTLHITVSGRQYEMVREI
ncbi:MAG: GNAT family N-acetyltransferase [Rikenellaceae bacterium]|nr:GNAT family N-acetyltransferase [Rikenellaceae bacterium]